MHVRKCHTETYYLLAILQFCYVMFVMLNIPTEHVSKSVGMKVKF